MSTSFQGECAEAEALYKRCQEIQEKVLGPEHPRFATTLHIRAGLLLERVRSHGFFQEVLR